METLPDYVRLPRRLDQVLGLKPAMTVEAIAKELGMSENGVEHILREAQKKFYRRLWQLQVRTLDDIL